MTAKLVSELWTQDEDSEKQGSEYGNVLMLPFMAAEPGGLPHLFLLRVWDGDHSDILELRYQEQALN
jgi:hypothetical protein